MSTIETFLSSLRQYEGDGVYNPWRDYDERCDCGPDAPLIRSRQLTDYAAVSAAPNTSSSPKPPAIRAAALQA